MPDYIPTKDADLDAWATNFDTVITAAPTSYGLVAGQATTFNGLRTAFTSALATATNPGTRTVDTVAAKDTARSAMVASARQLAAIAQGYPSITPALLADAGLTVRDTIPSPIPAPSTQPVLSVQAILPGQHVIKYHDSVSSAPRGLPYGVIGLQIGRKTGATTPTAFADCDFVGQLGRSPLTIDTTTIPAGTLVHYICRYVTKKGLVGPDSAVLSTVAA